MASFNNSRKKEFSQYDRIDRKMNRKKTYDHRSRLYESNDSFDQLKSQLKNINPKDLNFNDD